MPICAGIRPIPVNWEGNIISTILCCHGNRDLNKFIVVDLQNKDKMESLRERQREKNIENEPYTAKNKGALQFYTEPFEGQYKGSH